MAGAGSEHGVAEDPAALREAAVAWRHRAHDVVCDRREAWGDLGAVVWASDIPTYYDFNTLRLERPAPGATAAEIAAEADRLQAGLAHRKVEVEDAETGARLRPEFEALGWQTVVLLWMAHDGPPPAPRDGVAVSRVDPPAIRHLRLEWVGPQTREQIEEHMPVQDAVYARLGVRDFAVRDGDGAIAFARLLVDEEIAQAEVLQVFVTGERRGAGVGGALTAAAVREGFEAGARRIWIVADAEERARNLYARLGFKPAWTSWEFTLQPRAAA